MIVNSLLKLLILLIILLPYCLVYIPIMYCTLIIEIIRFLKLKYFIKGIYSVDLHITFPTNKLLFYIYLPFFTPYFFAKTRAIKLMRFKKKKITMKMIYMGIFYIILWICKIPINLFVVMNLWSQMITLYDSDPKEFSYNFYELSNKYTQ